MLGRVADDPCLTEREYADAVCSLTIRLKRICTGQYRIMSRRCRPCSALARACISRGWSRARLARILYPEYAGSAAVTLKRGRRSGAWRVPTRQRGGARCSRECGWILRLDGYIPRERPVMADGAFAALDGRVSKWRERRWAIGGVHIQIRSVAVARIREGWAFKVRRVAP